MSPALARRVVVIMLLLLSFGYNVGRWPAPTLFPQPVVEKKVAETVDNPYVRQREERQLEAWREALAQALVQLAEIEIRTARKIACGVYQASLRRGTDPLRLAGFVLAESRGNPKAVSHKGAHGLMQILPETGEFIADRLGDEWRGPDSLHEVRTSIDYGAWYYKYLLQQFEGNELAALAAYNWGPQHVERRLQRRRKLPIVYPSKVVAAQEEITAALREEYNKRFWWAHDPRIGYPGYSGESSSNTCPDPVIGTTTPGSGEEAG